MQFDLFRYLPSSCSSDSFFPFLAFFSITSMNDAWMHPVFFSFYILDFMGKRFKNVFFSSSTIVFRASIYLNDLFKTVLSLNSIFPRSIDVFSLWLSWFCSFVFKAFEIKLTKDFLINFRWHFLRDPFRSIIIHPSLFFLRSLETTFMVSSNKMNREHETSCLIIIFKLLSDKSWKEIFLFS